MGAASTTLKMLDAIEDRAVHLIGTYPSNVNVPRPLHQSAYCGRTVPDLRDLAASSSPLKHAASTTEKEEGGGGGQLDGDATTSMLRSTSCTVLTWTDDTALPSLRGHGILYCRAKDIAVALAPQGLRLF
ncbi:unnamed protein product [Lampetra planeri]